MPLETVPSLSKMAHIFCVVLPLSSKVQFGNSVLLLVSCFVCDASPLFEVVLLETSIPARFDTHL